MSTELCSAKAAAADYDNDGYPDLYVSNLNGKNFLYHNNHDNTFTEVAGPAGVPGSGHGFATWFFDYDNDGWPDLVTSYFVSVDETARTYLGLPHNATTLKLYKNMKDGTFRDVTTVHPRSLPQYPGQETRTRVLSNLACVQS